MLIGYYIGLLSICLSVHGLCLTLMGLLYGVYLLSEIVDTLDWKRQCKRKLQSNEKLVFRYTKTKRRINQIIYIAFSLCLLVLAFNSIYRLIVSVQQDGIQKSFTLITLSLVYFIIVPVFALFRGEFKKRGGFEQVCSRLLLLLTVNLVSGVVVNGLGSVDVSYAPEKFNINYNTEMNNKYLHTGKSVLGSSEDFMFWGSSYDDGDYNYRLYKSEFPFILKQIVNEKLRTEGIRNYLNVYEQTDKYTIYTAYHHKVYPEDATYQTHDTDLENYEGCILLESKDEFKFLRRRFW
ncbi:MAG: hypothetical protein ACERKZ_07220 [Lachnotalea sp.]